MRGDRSTSDSRSCCHTAANSGAELREHGCFDLKEAAV